MHLCPPLQTWGPKGSAWCCSHPPAPSLLQSVWTHSLGCALSPAYLRYGNKGPFPFGDTNLLPVLQAQGPSDVLLGCGGVGLPRSLACALQSALAAHLGQAEAGGGMRDCSEL